MNKEPIPSHWDCGCGWHKGLDFSVCAMCGRTPAEGNAAYRYREPYISLSDVEISLMSSNEDDGDWNDLRYKESWHEGYLAGAHAVICKMRGK